MTTLSLTLSVPEKTSDGARWADRATSGRREPHLDRWLCVVQITLQRLVD